MRTCLKDGIIIGYFFGTLFLNVEMPKKMKKTAKSMEGSNTWKDIAQILLPLFNHRHQNFFLNRTENQDMKNTKKPHFESWLGCRIVCWIRCCMVCLIGCRIGFRIFGLDEISVNSPVRQILSFELISKK